MSRQIDDTRPYTDEEKEYLLTRSGGAERIAWNATQFAHLSDDEAQAARDRATKDDEDEAKIQEALKKAQEEAESDSYHPEDLAKVEGLNAKELRQLLRKLKLRDSVTADDKVDPDDEDNPFTEKEVLAIRALDYFDAVRNGTIDPESDDEEKSAEEESDDK